MSDPRDDELMVRLADLPAEDVDPWRAERIRRRAHEVMRVESSPVSRWLDRAERIYARTLEPVVVFGVGTVYLLLALQSAMELLG